MQSSLVARMLTKLLVRRDDPNSSAALISRLLSDQGRKHWRGYAFAFACMALMAGATSLSAWIMKHVIDRVFIEKDANALFLIAGVLAAVSLVKGFATYGQQVTLAHVANSIVADIQERVFAKMMQLRVSYLAARHSTEFIAKQSFISQSASSALNLIITALSRDTFTLIGLLTVMVVQDPLMSLIALVFMPLAVLGVRKLSSRVRKVMTTEFMGFASLMESMQEAAQGVKIVKAYTVEKRMTENQSRAIRTLERASNKLAIVTARSSPMMESLGGVAIALVVLYGGWRVIDAGQAPGTFFSFITAVLLAYEPAKRLAKVHIELNSALVGVTMLYEFLDQDEVEHEDANAPALKVTAGNVTLNDLHFAYRKEETVLKGLSLVAEGGKTTALVGRSGGGKSTVMALLLRFYDAQGGSISIDGQDISKVTRQSLRQSISYVSQETFLFHGTVRENIAIGKPDATDEEIIAAAKAAYAHDFIMCFDKGYDTHCGEQGLQLSGGQRQRISIARAFLKNSPILLLDEATSALDTESERAIQAALDQLREGRTTIVIAHRLSTIRTADKICVIQNGQVTEEGCHEELMRKKGPYQSMVNAQDVGMTGIMA